MTIERVEFDVKPNRCPLENGQGSGSFSYGRGVEHFDMVAVPN